jgi:hypothetical protein
MAEQKHTPGPWHCDGGVQVRTGQFLAICEAMASPNRSIDAARANARLIAAAPELLEALRLFVSVCDTAPPTELMASIGSACKQARAAIAKAEGK